MSTACFADHVGILHHSYQSQTHYAPGISCANCSHTLFKEPEPKQNELETFSSNETMLSSSDNLKDDSNLHTDQNNSSHCLSDEEMVFLDDQESHVKFGGDNLLSQLKPEGTADAPIFQSHTSNKSESISEEEQHETLANESENKKSVESVPQQQCKDVTTKTTQSLTEKMELGDKKELDFEI